MTTEPCSGECRGELLAAPAPAPCNGKDSARPLSVREALQKSHEIRPSEPCIRR